MCYVHVVVVHFSLEMQLLFIMQEGSTLFLVFIHCITGDVEPARMFDRTGNLTGNQIINYRCNPSKK